MIKIRAPTRSTTGKLVSPTCSVPQSKPANIIIRKIGIKNIRATVILFGKFTVDSSSYSVHTKLV
jgi:hypothetical protein